MAEKEELHSRTICASTRAVNHLFAANSCPLCKGYQIHPAYRGRKGSFLFRCPVCGIIFKVPNCIELSNYYSLILAKDIKAESTPLEVVSEIYKKVLSQLSRDCLIVDFGCGAGHFLEFLADAGYRNIIGVERSLRLAIHLRNKGLEVRENLLQIEDGSVDVVLAIEVLEHLEDPKSALAEIHRILKRSGSILITTPNQKSIKAKVLRWRWKEFRRPSHLIFFDRNSLKRLLEEVGFSRARGLKDIYYTRYRPIEFCLNLLGLTGNIRFLAFKD